MKEHIQYDFLQDGHFAELKEAEIIRRLDMLQNIEPYIGTFFSKEVGAEKCSKLTDDEIDDMQKEINKRRWRCRRWWSRSTTRYRWCTRYPSQGGIIGADDIDKYIIMNHHNKENK